MKKETTQMITGVIYCVSGLRVGGSDELLSAGAADLTVIKNPVTLQPYIPGSSLKGKLRAEMETHLDRTGYYFDVKASTIKRGDQNDPCGCGGSTCLVCRVFGPHKNLAHHLGPSRLIARDAQPLPDQTIIYEVKTESANNRHTGGAHDPRNIERVPAGTKFSLKLALQSWDIDKESVYQNATGKNAIIAFIKHALSLVQATGLGSGISRGSGEIEFRDLKLDGVPFTL